MKFILKLFILAISLCMLTAVYTSCEKQNGDNTETSAATDESPASIETRQFFTDYYNEINNKNFSVITDYFAEDEETLQSKIDNFTFMATMFDVKYEIDSVEAMYLEDGNISVSLITLITSENKDSGSVTVMKEPSSYLLEKKDNKLMIISYAVGESEVVSMN